MADCRQHMLIGAGVTTLTWVIFCRLTERPLKLVEILAAGAAGAVIALLPDALEPALHSHHREFFHSFAAAGLLTYTTKQVWQNPAVPEHHRIALGVSAVAYLSHLCADAFTPMGLPFI